MTQLLCERTGECLIVQGVTWPAALFGGGRRSVERDGIIGMARTSICKMRCVVSVELDERQVLHSDMASPFSVLEVSHKRLTGVEVPIVFVDVGRFQSLTYDAFILGLRLV